MRSRISFLALAVLSYVVLPAHADELTFTLDSYIGYGSAGNLGPDPNSCLPPDCVLFTGTLTDTDVDLQPDNSPSFLGISVPYTGTPTYTGAPNQVDFGGALLLDNTAPPGVLSGDVNWATDGLLNPPNMYLGPIFGIDIPVGTPVGVYVDAVNLDITPTNGNSPFTVSALVTVVVAPEPPAVGCLFAGLAALAAWYGVKRKWPSFDASR